MSWIIFDAKCFFAFFFALLVLFFLNRNVLASGDNDYKNYSSRDISLWIDEKQVKEFSDIPMKIFAIADGHVLPIILDPNFESYLPIIPSEVVSVNFTWQSGENKIYSYDFDQLISFNTQILFDPIISINRQGRVPRKPSIFQVHIDCIKNASGLAAFAIGLQIVNIDGQALAGMPIRLKLKKQCAYRGPAQDCDKKCLNGAWCNADKLCVCQPGYIGQFCESALCFPQCMNGGVCTSPGVCNCTNGWQGLHCEGGMCQEKCLNGGKCDQKDTCSCRRGYYGPRCEYSKCMIPCLNGGRCIGLDKCKCKRGYLGPQCETPNPKRESYRRNQSRRRKKDKFV